MFVLLLENEFSFFSVNRPLHSIPQRKLSLDVSEQDVGDEEDLHKSKGW